MLLVSALLISFFILVFSELRRKAGGLTNVDTGEAVKLINNDGVVIEIRSSDAVSRGLIVNAKNIPPDELDGRMSEIEKFKTTPIVAVCDNGITATRTVTALRYAGFESVYNLKGGMNGWTQAGRPVVTGKKTRSKSKKQKKKG